MEVIITFFQRGYLLFLYINPLPPHGVNIYIPKNKKEAIFIKTQKEAEHRFAKDEHLLTLIVILREKMQLILPELNQIFSEVAYYLILKTQKYEA